MANNTIAVLRQMLASLDDAKKYQSLRDVMSTMNAPDLAAVFEDLPEEKMPVLFRLCPKDLAADVFAELGPETQEALIRGLTDRELKSVVEELCVDDATDLVEEMPASVVKRILAQAEPDTRKMINELLKYPEDSAGGVMTTEFMELAPDWTVRGAMNAIRQNGVDKETINNCYVTRKDRTLVGGTMPGCRPRWTMPPCRWCWKRSATPSARCSTLGTASGFPAGTQRSAPWRKS